MGQWGLYPDIALCFLDGSTSSLANTTDNPARQSVFDGGNRAFANGGFVYLRSQAGGGSYAKELCAKFVSGKYGLMAPTRSADAKLQLLEWWELIEPSFGGTMRFGDDEWDECAVCSDSSIATALFSKFIFVAI